MFGKMKTERQGRNTAAVRKNAVETESAALLSLTRSLSHSR